MAKRGRPILSNSSDINLLKRRKKERERIQRYRDKKRLANNYEQTIQQYNQAETIAEFVPEDIAISTPEAIGLRLQDLDIAQDPNDAQLQQKAIEIDEHNSLYTTNINSDTTEAIRFIESVLNDESTKQIHTPESYHTIDSEQQYSSIQDTASGLQEQIHIFETQNKLLKTTTNLDEEIYGYISN
jgi:hypothetical protein